MSWIRKNPFYYVYISIHCMSWIRKNPFLVCIHQHTLYVLYKEGNPFYYVYISIHYMSWIRKNPFLLCIHQHTLYALNKEGNPFYYVYISIHYMSWIRKGTSFYYVYISIHCMSWIRKNPFLLCIHQHTLYVLNKEGPLFIMYISAYTVCPEYGITPFYYVHISIHCMFWIKKKPFLLYIHQHTLYVLNKERPFLLCIHQHTLYVLNKEEPLFIMYTSAYTICPE